jgi:hypothetical protein
LSRFYFCADQSLFIGSIVMIPPSQLLQHFQF